MTALLTFFLIAAQSGFEAQYIAGLKALNNLDLPTAQTDLQAAGRLQPANPRVWIALSQTYLRMGKTALANDAALKAEKFGADDPVTLRLLATFYAEQNKFDRAGDIEARCLAKDKQDVQAPARAMADYLEADLPRKAIAIALSTEGWETRPDLRNLLGKAYEADGQILKTIPELQEAIRLRPSEASYYADLIQVLVAHYNFDLAIQVGNAARQKFPASAQIALLTGVAHYGLHEADSAIDSFLKAIALEPSAAQPYHFLLLLMAEAPARLPDIARAFTDYEEKNPQSYLGSFLHAKVLNAELRDPEQAEALLRKSIALNAKFADSHYELGLLLAARHALPEAEKELRLSTTLNPGDPAAHYRLFRVLASEGKTREAEAELALQRKAAAKHDADLNRQAGGVKRFEITTAPPGK